MWADSQCINEKLIILFITEIMLLISYPVTKGMIKWSDISVIIHSILISDIAVVSIYWNDFPGTEGILESRKVFQKINK